MNEEVKNEIVENVESEEKSKEAKEAKEETTQMVKEKYFKAVGGNVQNQVAKYFQKNASDNLLANAMKLDKNVPDAVKYLMAEVKKQAKGENSAIMTDEDCYGIMTHYFEELEIPKYDGCVVGNLATSNSEIKVTPKEEKPIEKTIDEAKKQVEERKNEKAKEKKQKPKVEPKKQEEEYNLFSGWF